LNLFVFQARRIEFNKKHNNTAGGGMMKAFATSKNAHHWFLLERKFY